MKNKNKDNLQLFLLLAAIALIIGGTIWGGAKSFLVKWDHPIGLSDEFHIWYHLPISPGICIILGIIFLFVVRHRS